MGSPNFLIKILYVKRNYYCDSSFTQFDLVKVTVILLVIKKKSCIYDILSIKLL